MKQAESIHHTSPRRLPLPTALSLSLMIVVSLITQILIAPQAIAWGCDEAGREARADFYAKNNMPSFYDPCEDTCTPGMVVGGAIGSTTELDEDAVAVLEQILNFFTKKGMTLAQAAAIAGNFQQESSFRPTIVNGGAYGLAQWLDRRHLLEQRIAVVQGEIDAYIANNQNDKARELLVNTQLEFVMEELYSTESLALTVLRNFPKDGNVRDLAVAFGETYERYGTDEEGDRGIFAAEIYAKYMGKIADGSGLPKSIDGSTSEGGSSGTASAVKCGVSVGAVTNNIAQTAINLAWEKDDPTRPSDPREPKPSYKAAMEEVGLWGTGCGPGGGVGSGAVGADCSVFVATVMRASGVDKNFPIGTSAQIPYLFNPANGYIAIPTTSTEDLQPGDIFILSGHVYMYVGGKDGEPNIGEASCDDFAGQRVGNVYFNDSLGRGMYTVYRKVSLATTEST